MSTATEPADAAGGMRLRKPQNHPDPTDVSANAAVPPSPSIDRGSHDAGARPAQKTFGRTSDGTVFIVPDTDDMVSLLLDPRQPKNISDAVILAVLALHGLLAYLLPSAWKRPVCALVFLFWRAAYNIGIGLLLRSQSRQQSLVAWARRCALFQDPRTGHNPRPWLYAFLRRELQAKMPRDDYDFDSAPLEYNTWLVFRRAVDLILMCDFTSYCLFAVVCAHTPTGEGIAVGVSRWALGIAIAGFSAWVKLDAHRVVKAFAWYWGDFFFLVDQDLTFDGVFEMVPHPMYSIGYVGYYGISMMAASYEVLFISIFAHIAQFAFLVLVENPHIDKIYNPPPPRERLTTTTATATSTSTTATTTFTTTTASSGGSEDSTATAAQTAAASNGDPRPAIPAPQHYSPDPVHDLVGLNNLDLFRVPDCVVIILPAYIAAFTLVTPSSPAWQAIFVAHALAWRAWYHVGLGLILDRQSKTKMWTRHFLKFGEGVDEAWRQWKGIYHISLTMVNVSYIAACWKIYQLPEDWGYGLVLLKHVLGAGLIALQLWTAFSVYDSLGEFGWFCGDFFFDHEAKLTYTSIYRFLNNPERVFGTAGVWGGALITWSPAMFTMALATQIMNAAVISFVERPHMRKIYGRRIRQEAGLTKFIKRSLPPPVKGWQKSVDKVLDDTSHFVEEFLDFARPMFAAGVKTIVRDTTALFNTAPARLTITRITPELAGLDPKRYSLAVEGTYPLHSAHDERATGKESLTGRFPKGVKTMVYEYGAPLRVRWRAPANHSSRDWIGLYMVTDNRSRETTEVSSLGRWIPTNPSEYGGALGAQSSSIHGSGSGGEGVARLDPSDPDMVEGEVVFQGDKLWWTQGVFEFRYHHDGHHNVMSVSEPFEILIGKFDEEDVDIDAKGMYVRAVEAAMLPVVQNCLDRDPDIAPSTLEETFGRHVERDGKYAKRIVYAIREMFGIEFAPAVVLADRNVKKLAWRICNAKAVLAPYSMSHSKGAATPDTQEEEGSKEG
ncbi:Phosphatidylethanolamine N-methyltransferase [Escovopsis weberi]|uniref:Phosphatidylethanolamine N-methyltransferase n=1 Tax=Escovopsis weberi TaxID=150374 RepID=A0A0M8N1C3_ESCWE|nr:Phosphatidylethanolamine N-methyltransferase [Escovopsis weberi]